MTSSKSLLRYMKKMDDDRQELLAEEGAFLDLAQLLIDRGVKRVFLISGKQTQKLKLYDAFVEKLQSSGTRCFTWAKVGKVAENSVIEACATECSTYNCEAIVAFGGGAVIEVAKMVAVWLKNSSYSLYQMRGIDRIPKKGLPLYVVSTTCSGAESSACAFVHNDNLISLYYSKYLVPDVTVLDPDLVLRLPMEHMASAAILALSHAVEAFISPMAIEFPADKANIQIAIPIYFSYLEKSYKHGAGNDVFLQMMMAPYYTGVATRRIGFGPAHSLIMYVAEKYGEAPGRVASILLPAVLEYEFDEVKEDLAQLALTSHLCSARATTEEAARAFIAGFKSLCRRVDMPTALPFLKLEDMSSIIGMALYDAKQWGCPKKPNLKAGTSILKKARYCE
ncbi:MAG TPA: hypothetical protein DCW43_05590 [Clostridiales bacterium]|nr:hypothetical protein [Clostridiales bacterium]